MLTATAAFARNSHDDEDGQGKNDQKEYDKAQKKADEAYDKDLKQEHKQYQRARQPTAKRQREDIRQGAYFDDRQRGSVHDYYNRNYGNGKNCPTGRAKKNNGCMPPGQARNWQVGQPVPRGVTVYAVSATMARRAKPETFLPAGRCPTAPRFAHP